MPSRWDSAPSDEKLSALYTDVNSALDFAEDLKRMHARLEERVNQMHDELRSLAQQVLELRKASGAPR